MDNKKKLIYLGLGILLVVGILIVYFFMNKEEKEYSLKTVTLENCNNRAKVYYDDNTNKIYTYCLSSVKVDFGNKEYELSTYLKDKKIKVKDFFAKLLLDEEKWPTLIMASDGGTTIYNHETINLIRCNKILGEEGTNQDIFIGSKAMGFKNNYCLPDIKTVTRTYKVLKITNESDSEYKITLEQYKGEKATILYKNSLDGLIENQTYEFEFLPYNYDSIEDTIEALFKDSLIISVYKTNKVGENQIQEPISELNNEERETLVEKTKKTTFAQELIQYSQISINYFYQFKVEDGSATSTCYLVNNYKDGSGFEGCMKMNYETDKVESVYVNNAEYYYEGDFDTLLDNKGDVINKLTPGYETINNCPVTCIDPTLK